MEQETTRKVRTQRVTLIRGDGIGPEITAAVQEIFDAAAVPIEWEEHPAGLECLQRYGTPLPGKTVESILRNRVALKGPTTTPVGTGHKSINVTIRKALDLFANVRPARSLPGVRTRFENVDLLVVRENIEDTYGGIEHWQTPDVVQQLRIITRPGSETFLRFAFELALRQGRHRITCVHKANIHKMSDGLFRERFYAIAAEFPQLTADDILVDNLCMQLVVRPETFDVLVLPNLFGDIVSDLCAGLVGGLGVAPGGNIGRGRAVFEAVHGSAPDIAGKGIANPTALLLSATQMLHYLGLHRHAQRIEEALRLTLASGIRTRDLGGGASTREFTRAIISNLAPLDFTEEPSLPPAPEEGPQPVSNAAPTPWTLLGMDVFVRSPKGIPELPEQLGPLRLRMISNRGTRVYPGPPPPILLVDWYRCRYLAEHPLSRADILAALSALTQAGIEWMHVEMLHHTNGEALYSKAQGEE
jgi:NAD-dependent isocitrate dehydrogenase